VSFYDSRQDVSSQARAAIDIRAARAMASKPVRALQNRLGDQGVIDLDPTTLTPRNVSKLNGFLTGPSTASPASIGLDYVTSHSNVFHLTSSDLAGLKLARDYVDIDGVSHLSWEQTIGGVPLFDNGLKANVSKSGRLINVQGSPVSDLSVPAAAPTLSASAAISRAKADIGASTTAPARGDTARRVLFASSGGTRSAYEVVAMSVVRPALLVVDGISGRVLFRESLTSDASRSTTTAQDEHASVFNNYPGAAIGGTPQTVDLTASGWLPAGSVALFGNNAHTYTDVNDNDAADSPEEIAPNGSGQFVFPLRRVTSVPNEPCSTDVCTWRPNTPDSWQVNRSQTATQNFYFINNYHDHLQAAPIGFTPAAGNFQQVNPKGKGLGGDPVQDEPLDGADIDNGLPDGSHIDNANFATPPDGQAPRMQMYLWHQPGTKYPGEDPFIASSGSDEADIVYHEYTHGLSHRLIVDTNDVPALDSQQGASMGEAWSDWYALDYLVDQGFMKNTSAPGEVEVGKYVLPTEDFRSEPTDCPVGTTSAKCPGTTAAGPGGYTYGDLGKICSCGAEVHADGEIWAQTLWDVRTALGSNLAESLITRGMELSPTFPSYLDMRNAIIQADVVDHAGKQVNKLWQIFASRGMGFFAGSITGDDVHPVENFSLPPTSSTPKSTVMGKVVDSATGKGVPNTVVAFGGHDSGFPGSYATQTKSNGTYSIPGVFVGRYPDVFSGGAGYNTVVKTVQVRGTTTHVPFTLQRDWAASSGGASISASNGNDSAAFGCGPDALIDQSLASGWSTAKPTSGGKFATIKLPQAVNITQLQVDPSGTCGDDIVASAGQYKIETSTNGTAFTTAAQGTFTPSDIGHLTTVPLSSGTGAGVTFIRYTILSNQAAELGVSCPSSGDEGCPWLDSQELEVFGSPTP
jgi:extracellular elastinolytic metalloproteinase